MAAIAEWRGAEAAMRRALALAVQNTIVATIG